MFSTRKRLPGHWDYKRSTTPGKTKAHFSARVCNIAHDLDASAAHATLFLVLKHIPLNAHYHTASARMKGTVIHLGDYTCEEFCPEEN